MSSKWGGFGQFAAAAGQLSQQLGKSLQQAAGAPALGLPGVRAQGSDAFSMVRSPLLLLTGSPCPMCSRRSRGALR